MESKQAEREERFLMRQRGAGARQLRDSGFSIGIPSASGTPAQPSPLQPRTPGSSVRRRRIQKEADARDNALARATQVDEDGSTVKKRRLAPAVEKTPRTGGSLPQIPETVSPRPGLAKGRSTLKPQARGTALAENRKKSAAGSKEDETTPTGSTVRKKKRKSISQSAVYNAKRNKRASLENASPIDHVTAKSPTLRRIEQAVPAPIDKEASLAVFAAPSKSVPLSRKGISSHPSRAQDRDGEASKSSSRSAKPPPLPNVEEVESTEGSASEEDWEAENEDGSLDEERESIPQAKRAGPNLFKSAHKSRRTIPGKASVTRVARPKAGARETLAAAKEPKAASLQSKGPPTIPVTVHRLSRRHALDFLPDDDDELAGPAPLLLTRAAPNAVDVLAQICREMIGKTIDGLGGKSGSKDGAGISKADRKSRRKIIESFLSDLETRMLQLSSALDHNIGLSKALRRHQREKSALTRHLLSVRGEREEVILQLDAVRDHHEQKRADALAKLAINSDLHDIELAVHRGRLAEQQQQQQQQRKTKKKKTESNKSSSGGGGGAADPADGGGESNVDLTRIGNLEAMVKSVVASVRTSSGVGLKRKIGSFNEYLEAVIGVL